jgi:hypothetical protein
MTRFSFPLHIRIDAAASLLIALVLGVLQPLHLGPGGHAVEMTYSWLYSTMGGATFYTGFMTMKYDRDAGTFTGVNVTTPGQLLSTGEAITDTAFARKEYNGDYVLRVGRF